VSFTIGTDSEIGLDGNGFWVKPGSYKVKRPRISKAQYRADGTLSYVDVGPGKRTWSMIILAKNNLLKYDGIDVGITGEQYRDNLLNSYVNNIATTIVFTDPKNTAINVYFELFEETIMDLKSQIIPLSTGGSVAPSYEVLIELLEA
jgi:hypothetical protein